MIVDAIRYEDASNPAVSEMLPYVLSMPRRCPCGDVWLILLNEPLVLEVELGSAGHVHLQLLEESIAKSCATHEPGIHLRTDGETVWIVS